jgi:fatty acid desaturase
MNDLISEQTKALKKKYARSFQNDGLLDFFIGWALVSAGIFLQTGSMIFSFLSWMPILFIAPIKWLFVIPRFGYVKFSKPTTIPRPILIGAGILIAGGALFFTFFSGETGFSSPVAIALLAIGLLFSIGMGVSRVAVYMIFVPLLFIIGLGLDILPPALVIIIGSVLMLLGIYLFLRFLKKYPADPGEEKDNS